MVLAALEEEEVGSGAGTTNYQGWENRHLGIPKEKNVAMRKGSQTTYLCKNLLMYKWPVLPAKKWGGALGRADSISC
jgi:hypothetical protein